MKPGYYKQLFNRALFTWLLFIPIVVLNGALREAVYKPFTGELAAHQISTVIASVAFLTLAYFRMKKLLPNAPKVGLYGIGIMWVGLTVLFEFGLGLFLRVSWEKMFHDYNILEGRIWVLFLLTVLFTPVIVKKWLTINKTNKLQLSK